MIAGVDYELVWPRELFRQELALTLETTSYDRDERIDLLLEEAFAGPGPKDDVKRDGQSVLFDIRDHIDDLTEAPLRRPRWSERRGGVAPAPLAAETVVREFVRVVNELDVRGYFEYAFDKDCVDDPRTQDPSTLLEVELGRAGLWPCNVARLTEDTGTFYDLVEALHDLVARPRARSMHSYAGCGWHHSDFSRSSGQILYRWRVNRLLASSEIQLRVAESGEDMGRLVEATDDARNDLVKVMTDREDLDTGERVRHALALFRQRGATEHDERSAILALVGMLEERRDLLKNELFKKDEGALFEIANEFAIRHQRAGQQGDYDPLFLDWIFWWYLATIELSDRLVARSAAQSLPEPF